MSNNVKGRGVRVEFGATYSLTPIVITAVTNANPGVATATAHGLVDADCGYWDGVTGMEQLNGQAIRVNAPTANTFELQGLNTTSMPVFNTGNFYKVLSWMTFAESTSYSIGGGGANKLDASRLIDVIAQEENGLLAAQTLGFNMLAQTIPTACLQLIESSAQQTKKIYCRITHPDGAVRIAYGEPSFPGEDVQQGALGTGSLTMAVKGFILKLPA
jgi:Phage tail tube protein, TTP